jgi:hypothetical protein
MSRRLNRRQTYEPPSSCRTVARHLISLHRSAPPRGAGGRRAERLLEADCVLVGLDDSVEAASPRTHPPRRPRGRDGSGQHLCQLRSAGPCLGRRLTEVRSGVFDEGLQSSQGGVPLTRDFIE